LEIDVASKREQVIEAVKSLLVAALPDAEVKRNLDKPERIPPGGLVIVRDGDPGDPDVLLSPLVYVYEHRVPIEIAAFASASLSREEALDQMLSAIGAAVAADRTLGGLCEFLDTEAPVSDNLETAGALSGRWAEAAIIAAYSTTNPLT
jgi:hypothetical protein